MNELQLKLCDIQGRLFELSGARGYDSAIFMKAFMTSEVAKGLDSKFNRLQWAGEEYLIAELAETAGLSMGGNVYDKEVLYWSGYLYRFWHFTTGESSKAIGIPQRNIGTTGSSNIVTITNTSDVSPNLSHKNGNTSAVAEIERIVLSRSALPHDLMRVKKDVTLTLGTFDERY